MNDEKEKFLSFLLSTKIMPVKTPGVINKKTTPDSIFKSPLIRRTIRIFIVVAALFAFLSHLGYLPLDIESDEARRAVVSAEMMISKNYLTPTINGEIYLNKPPLYNWIVIAFFKLFGNYSMFAFRLPVIISAFLTGILIYFFTKKYTNNTVGFFTALAYITNGRFLIYESLYGFIDTTFSLVAYANIICIFYFGEKKKYTSLFLLSYFLCAIAFFLKALPALAIQILTLGVYFLIVRNFKQLFSLQHVTGILIFIFILTCYYVPYFHYNHYSPVLLFENLVHESSKRTAIEYGISATIKHVFTFPFEVFYHFLPWTIFAIALLKKNTLQLIRANRFIYFSVLTLLVNIIIYWVSVDVYPKYIFMFIPLLYSVLFYCYFKNEELKNSWQKKFITIFIVFACLCFLIATLSVPFLSYHFNTHLIYLKVILLSLVFFFCTYFSIKQKYQLHCFLIAFIFVRIGFNWFVLEQRGEKFVKAENAASKIVSLTKGSELYILNNQSTSNFDGMSFHISTRRNEILTRKDSMKPGAFYIVDSTQLKQSGSHAYISFINFPFPDSLYLIKFKD